MRKTLTAAGTAVLMLGVGAVPASAAPKPSWRVTYVSPDSGYDDFGLYSVSATGRNDAWAVGSKRMGAGGGGAILRWNGRRWHEVTIPGSTGSFQAVGGSSGNDVWVLGVNATGASTAWHWNGLWWTHRAIPGYDAGDITVLNRHDAWAVGGNEGGAKANALHWDGKAWREVAMPHTAFKVAAVSANDVWAVGSGTNDQPYAAHWNGRAWTTAKLPKVPLKKGTTGFSYFNDVVALSKNSVWAVGRFYWRVPGKPGHNQPVLMHWNGSKWSLTLGSTGDFALSVASDGTGGIWYSSGNGRFVHRTRTGSTTTVAVPAPTGRRTADIRDITSTPHAPKLLAVGQTEPAPGDESWDALIEQYGE
jgi:hypothetical protein